MSNHTNDKWVIGIDVGSVSISLVCLDLAGNLVTQEYVLHHGDIRNVLTDMLKEYDPEQVMGIAAPSGKIRLREHVHVFDTQVSLMAAVSTLGFSVRSILHVGAERFFLAELDAEGKYMQTSHSSSCAAGTGSFLDQQALRLNLNDTAHLSDMALKNSFPIPDIAARCSVFAKTDLIHAQQKGYSLEAICDSLCKGLADNIADTLFNKTTPESPILMTGGVSRNRSVVRHLQRILGKEIIIHPQSHHFPAIGAANILLAEIESGRGIRSTDIHDILADQGGKEFFFEPLKAPNGTSGKVDVKSQTIYEPAVAEHTVTVQIENYGVSTPESEAFYLGIDVGSTSTKAVLVNTVGEPFSGYYTYTSGQPLKAVQALFEAMDHHMAGLGIGLKIAACGTTGSGRKFIGGIIRADEDVDEITAHARAAFELNPLTDTIIEIGGQDAKFTQMKEGMVTFSHMNTVCAAGTGSFIEELAGRLGVKLADYERLAIGKPAPLASDRCTVFMERDINQLLSQGYSVEEVLATVIHSVRENYLKKVASEAHIGDHICFQGATAKNRALVAAFEQRLQKPIYVSPLCHLTGALGTALLLMEEHRGSTRFRGVDLYKRKIPVQTETCELCLNRCTISVASLNGEKVAYGFLCGRDYETRKYVKKAGEEFDLMKERKRLMKPLLQKIPDRESNTALVGLPATLHLVEDMPFWKLFFTELDIPFLSSEDFKDSLKTGKKIAGAEFCAPVDSMYGHVSYLAEKCDYIFMPVYLEARVKAKGTEQNFCYYTQFSASLAFQETDQMKEKLVSPMLNFNKLGDHNARLLLKELKNKGFGQLTLARVSEALRKAGIHAGKIKRRLEELYEKTCSTGEDVSVVLLGRPYVVLSGTLNKGIPDIFAGMCIRAYYQDMLKVDPNRDESFNQLLGKIPWHFAANILRAAEVICRTKNLYPVLVTAFKCAPDSFIIEYFKHLMHLYGKPYLIIQIDEHDSNTGYETRIEAALRSFRNHAVANSTIPDPDLGSLLPRVDTELKGKTLLMPNWDTYVSPLIAANLSRTGMDVRLLESSELGIRKSMVHNTGQCLPISIIAQDYIDYIEKHGLDPSRVILWMMEGKISCNLRQYPFFIKRILENYGKGLEQASVYTGEISHRELSLGVTYYAYFAYMLGGLFRKMACRIRPYELVPGQTDMVNDEVHRILVNALSGNQTVDSAIREGIRLFEGIDYHRESRKPLVAIFGDLYVRDNDIMNQELVRSIEEAGGEVLVTPYHDYSKLVLENIFRRASQRGEYVETGVNRILLNVLKFMDDKYYKPFSKILGDAPVIKPKKLEKRLKEFNIDLLHSGESYDNILKIFYIMENYPEVSLFVQTNPSYCCPALVTEAMTRKIREMTGVPIVTITYDGTSDRMNDVIVPYIQNAKMKEPLSEPEGKTAHSAIQFFKF
ncbi:MAG: acyl-CoA dehydratase activase [Bacteroidota bacterium]